MERDSKKLNPIERGFSNRAEGKENKKDIGRRTFIKTTLALGGAASLAAISGKVIKAAAVGKASQFSVAKGFTTREKFDTIIANGLVYTGEIAEPIRADIGIRDGRITAIARLGRNCTNFVDATGKVVCPGFIDIHSHTDTNLFEAPLGDSKIHQGITTDIGGNCGGSPFPFSDREYAERKDTLRFGYPFWQNIDGFYNALKKNTIGINYGSYVGHGDIRHVVVGDNDVAATPEQLKQMCYILDKQLEMGAVGLSFGLEYAPGSYGRKEEFVALLKVVAKHDALFAIHMRNEDDRVEEAIAEAIELARRSGARLQISHLKAQNQNNWHKVPSMLNLIHSGVESGLDIHFDRYPYTAFATGLDCFIPLSHRQGSAEEILARLDNPAQEKVISEYALGRVKKLGGPRCILIAACFAPGNEKYTGKYLDECCKLSGMDMWPTIKYLLKSEKLNVNMAGFAMKEENLRTLLNDPLAMVITDGSVYSPKGRLGQEAPHPRSYGAFTNYIGKYVRDMHFCNLQTAINKCTALPASQLKLKDRGMLKDGYAADVLVFDYQKIADIATYGAPHQFSAGIEHVFVNGAHELKNGEYTGCPLAGVII
ncbi:MAG: D-aminoacylase [Bacteroidales bacterium]|nr:D-aminoacylase [Bacteroidales bacterium]